MNKYLLAATLVALIELAACTRPPPPTESSSATSQAAANQSSSTALVTPVPAGEYTLDKSHASLIFRVDHLGFSKYTAQFKAFDAQLNFDPQHLEASTIKASIDPSSLDLDNPPAGFVETLLSDQWLDAPKFPTMTFQSNKVESISGNTMRISGDFTLHGATKPITLEATFNGGYAGHPMDPHARIGFSAHGSLKRSEFGIAFGIPAPGTTMGVSDAVEIMIEAEFSGPPLGPPLAPPLNTAQTSSKHE